MQNNKYVENLAEKRRKKGGGSTPHIFGIPSDKQIEVEMVLNEQWLDGYKTAKKKYKNKR